MPAVHYHALKRFLVLAGVAAVLLPAWPSAAERPAASRLLPEETFAYLQVADTAKLVERFQETALGRIGQDPSMRPLIEQLYGAAIEGFRRVEEQIGASLDDLLSIPQGEMCFAVVAPEDGRPVVVFLLDVGDRLPTVDRILQRIGDRLVQDGAARSEQSVGDTRIVVYDLRGGGPRQLIHAERDGVLLLCTNAEVAKDVLSAWDGKAERRLADDPDFAGVMRRCEGTPEEPAHLTFFVDPIGAFSRLSRGNAGAQAALAMFPALGLNGVRGVGGSITFATAEYDALTHLHLLLDSPRTGVLELIALKSGEITPEPWVPADAASYVTLNWDFNKTYSTIAKLFDSIRGPDAFASSFERQVTENVGLDFRKDVLGVLDGRVTYVAAMMKPARINSRANLVGVKLKDKKAFQKTFDTVLAKSGGQLTKEAFAGTTYYRVPVGNEPPDAPQRPLLRRPDPALAILDDYFLASDSTDFLKQALAAKRDPSQGLAEQLEFRLVTSKIRRQPGGDAPGLIAFDRPEEAMRLWYELATAQITRERLAKQAENNQFFRTLNTALRDHPLPPFSTIAQYLAPSGSLLTSDEGGLHYVSFTLKRK